MSKIRERLETLADHGAANMQQAQEIASDALLALNAAAMAKRRLDDFADKANAGQVHYSARELKRKIGSAFADFDAADLG